MNEIEVRLLMLNGWIYILAEGRMIKISNRQLRYSGIPRAIMEYAIIKSKDGFVSVLNFEELEIKTRRDFNQIAYSAGFRGLAKKYFLEFCSTQGLKISKKVVLDRDKYHALVDDIKQRKAEAKASL